MRFAARHVRCRITVPRAAESEGANALTGLATVRDVLVTYATNHHLTSCGTISDADLTAFASETTAAARVTAAQALYATCNTACP